jgi:hypothetical protein
MYKIKLTESELMEVIKRIIKESEEPETNVLVSLRNYAKGKISKDDLYSVDDSIEHIQTKTPLGQSIITIKFDDDRELSEAIGLDENDRWFMNSVNSYHGHEFMDSYQITEDFKEGYIIYYELNEENLKKLKRISEIILPNEKFDMDDENFRQLLSNTLLDMFFDEIDYILDDYHSEKEREMNIAASEEIKKDFDDVLKEFGANINRDFDSIEITLVDLFMNAMQQNLYNSNAKEMVTDIIKSGFQGGSIGGWYENSYEFQDADKFDSEGFNNTVERQFDKILDELESNEDLEGYFAIRGRLSSKFEFGKWNKLPTDDRYKFNVRGVDKDDLKVNVELQTPLGFKVVKLTEENFNYLLYQPTLFNLVDI